MRQRPLLLLALLSTIAWMPAAQADSPAILSSGGEILRLLNGSYGELFPGGTDAAPDNPVLALEALSPDGTAKRWLVPDTESRDPEGSETMVLEESTRTVYLLWESLYNGSHPRLLLTSFDGQAFSERIEISRGPFSRKSSLRLAITREDFAVATEEGTEAGGRTMVHVLWSEDVSDLSHKYYAPIILQDGVYIGQTPVIDLAGLITGGNVGDSVPAGLANALAIRLGQDNRSVVVGFLDPLTRRLEAVRLRALPRELTDLAEKVRGELILIGARADSVEGLAEELAAAILEMDTHFHVAALAYIAEQVQLTVLSGGEDLSPPSIGALSDRVRGELILIGARMEANGLAGSDANQVLEMAGDHSVHQLEITPAASYAAPEVDSEDPVTLFLSESGANLLVAWDQEGGVAYRESRGKVWSEPVLIETGIELDREAVYLLLDQRIRDR